MSERARYTLLGAYVVEAFLCAVAIVASANAGHMWWTLLFVALTFTLAAAATYLWENRHELRRDAG